MEFVDLHVHSTCSDGTYTPHELVDYAVKKGLKAMALTDHDTIDGIDEMIEYAEDKPIEIIPGIEYSTEYNGKDVHILGLFIDYKAPVFLEYLERFKKSRTERNHKLCANLQGAGIDITYDELLETFPNAVITRAHYAKFLMDKGYVNSRNEAFDRYLGDHTPYFVHREKITPEEVIEVTLKAGGIPILAHPVLYGLGKEQLEILIKRLKNAGLMGIETIYSTYTPSDERQMKELAKKYRLLQSGGSDFHGDNKPKLDLAIGYGKLYVDGSIVEAMKKTLKTKILFTDLDGTLLTSQNDITEKTRDKIKEMLKTGNCFVLASGRPINSILDVFKKLDIEESGIYATAYNGAMLYDCINDEIIEKYDVPMNTAQKIVDMALERGIHIHTYTDHNIVSCAEDKELFYYTKSIKMEYVVGTRLDEVLEHAPFKLLAISLDDRESLEKFRADIEASDIGKDIVCAFSSKYYLEFYNKKAGKGNALVNLCNLLNINVKNSVAAGDEENDISMIEAAATGVCMANGNPNVKKIADYVTQNDNNNDGLAEIIDRFLC